ncbi:cytochrome P450 2E1-like [Mercenaria mercenaria]|uniref:cytochrome P450 2E1-like n=1 Tax=Mercenaria mercenaria TaxID=6596 RepID=UPI00234E4C44|nr:cytochrome P450 2E1-like [Mercenaria mercenaria]
MPGQLRDNFRKQCHVYDRIAQRYFHDVKKTYVPGRLRGVVDVYLDEQRKQMEAGSDVFLTDDLIIAQIVETVDTGVMTTWTTLTNSMLVLCNYPTYQTKIQAELDEVIGKDRTPTYKDRGKCTFFLAFEMEVHRFLPVLPLNLPHVSRSHVEFEGYDIKPNSTRVPFTLAKKIGTSHEEAPQESVLAKSLAGPSGSIPFLITTSRPFHVVAQLFKQLPARN